MKKILLLIWISGFLIILLLFMSCSNINKTQNKEIELACKCCKECSEAFGQSPAAVGPEGARCGQFMTGKPISKECEAYFKEHPMTVSGCDKMPDDSLKCK